MSGDGARHLSRAKAKASASLVNTAYGWSGWPIERIMLAVERVIIVESTIANPCESCRSLFRRVWYHSEICLRCAREGRLAQRTSKSAVKGLPYASTTSTAESMCTMLGASIAFSFHRRHSRGRGSAGSCSKVSWPQQKSSGPTRILQASLAAAAAAKPRSSGSIDGSVAAAAVTATTADAAASSTSSASSRSVFSSGPGTGFLKDF